MKILIIKLGALGDVLRTTFIARGLKEKYANATILWLTKEHAASILLNNPFVDKIIVWEQREVLLKNEFDWVIALDDEEEVCAFATQLKTKTKRFQGAYTDKNGKRRYTKDVEPWFGMGILHPEEDGGKEKADTLKAANRKTFQEIYAEMFDLKGICETKPLLFLTLDELQWGQNYVEQYSIPERNRIIGINSGAGVRWELKMMSKEKTAVMCRELAKNKKNSILLLGGIDEEERNKAIKSMCPEENILVIKPTNDIRKFASMLHLCDLLITTDSLALHIGLALDKKTLVYFGPTSPWEIEMFGLGKKIYKESDCLCCYKKTTGKNPSWIDRLTPEDILNPAQEMLADIQKEK